MQAMVRDFHQAFNHPAPDEPTMIDIELARKRVKWIKEEADEFLEAIEAGDMVAAYDAIIDGLYFGFGTAVVMGLDVGPGWLVVQESNMAKLHRQDDGTYEAVYNEDGKVIKPEGWQPPEPQLELVVAEQVRAAQILQATYALADGASLGAVAHLLGNTLTLEELSEITNHAKMIQNGRRPATVPVGLL